MNPAWPETIDYGQGKSRSKARKWSGNGPLTKPSEPHVKHFTQAAMVLSFGFATVPVLIFRQNER
jgi:hypothetical protein